MASLENRKTITEDELTILIISSMHNAEEKKEKIW